VERIQQPAGLPEKTVAPLQGAEKLLAPSGGLRYAATTGYYLTALQADGPNCAVKGFYDGCWSYLASGGPSQIPCAAGGARFLVVC